MRAVVCQECGAEATRVTYEHACAFGFTHVTTDSRNVGPDPGNDGIPAVIKCPGCACQAPAKPKFMVCEACGAMIVF